MSGLPATFLSVQQAVADKLRMTLGDDQGRIQDWINQTYADVAVETRCFQQQATSTMTAGVASYTLDSSLLHIELLTIKQAGGAAFFPLVECQLDEILNFRALNVAAGGPSRRYCLVGMNEIEFWPTPSAADTLNTWYSYLPTYLSADADLPGLPEPFGSKLLEYGALVQGAEWKRDILVLGQYQAQYQSWLQSFQRYLNRKAGAYPESFPTWTRLRPFAPHDASTDFPAYDSSA